MLTLIEKAHSYLEQLMKLIIILTRMKPYLKKHSRIFFDLRFYEKLTILMLRANISKLKKRRLLKSQLNTSKIISQEKSSNTAIIMYVTLALENLDLTNVSDNNYLLLKSIPFYFCSRDIDCNLIQSLIKYV